MPFTQEHELCHLSYEGKLIIEFDTNSMVEYFIFQIQNATNAEVERPRNFVDSIWSPTNLMSTMLDVRMANTEPFFMTPS